MDDSFTLNGINYCPDYFYDDYEVVKEISIEEKIEFWQEVMAYAHSRGVQFYIFTWNVYTFGEQGKYGITSDLDNEVTKDYYRASVQAMLETYPDLDGMGICAGENMNSQSANADKNYNEQWLYDTYGEGINAVLKQDPDRDFGLIHRTHQTVLTTCLDIWSDFKGQLDFSNKYTSDRTYSVTNPSYVDKDLETIDSLETETKLWLETRNSDMIYYRWGDPDFVREYMNNIPQMEDIGGFLMGSDSFILGREYDYADESLNGTAYIAKNWYSTAIWGRLGYNPELDNEYFLLFMKDHFADVEEEQVERLFEAMQYAGKIIPQCNQLFYYVGDSFLPELAVRNVKTYGYADVKEFMRYETTMPDANTMSVEEYVLALIHGEDPAKTGKILPTEVAEHLVSYGDSTMEIIEELEAKAADNLNSGTRKEFYGMVTDQRQMAEFGYYFAEKVSAAIDLRMYNETLDSAYQTSAVEHLEKAVERWKAFADVFRRQYVGQYFSRIQMYVDPDSLLEDVEKDIAVAKNWRAMYISEEGNVEKRENGNDDSFVLISENGSCKYAGDYYLQNSQGENVTVFRSFMIDEAGNVTGDMENSGMTTFRGTVDGEGNFVAVMERLSMEFSGKIDEHGNITGVINMAGREGELSGYMF